MVPEGRKTVGPGRVFRAEDSRQQLPGAVGLKGESSSGSWSMLPIMLWSRAEPRATVRCGEEHVTVVPEGSRGCDPNQPGCNVRDGRPVRGNAPGLRLISL